MSHVFVLPYLLVKEKIDRLRLEVFVMDHIFYLFTVCYNLGALIRIAIGRLAALYAFLFTGKISVPSLGRGFFFLFYCMTKYDLHIHLRSGAIPNVRT